MKEVETLSQQQLSAAATVYEAKVMPKDILSIVVSTVIPEASAPFNTGGSEYIVESDGYIEFPVVGRVRVEGMTRYEIQELVKNLIYPKYLKEEPLVKVRFINYKITILGEVRAPGSYTVDKEKCSIFDALAYAGDLTIYGKRNNVLLMREDGNGEKSFYRINLQDKDLVLYPSLFYLQQNDMLYVEPSSQVGVSTSASWIYSIITMGITLIFYALSFINK
jgi:polysaccharide export outer membrane protein